MSDRDNSGTPAGAVFWRRPGMILLSLLVVYLPLPLAMLAAL
jgi:hypothetical protein